MAEDFSGNELGFEHIELSLPVNAAYIPAARQTASAVSGRIGFDAEEVEDVQTAVSTACAYIISRLSNGGGGAYRVIFSPKQDHIDISLCCGAGSVGRGGYDVELIKGMIKNQMEGVEILEDAGVFVINMTKSHKDSGLTP